MVFVTLSSVHCIKSSPINVLTRLMWYVVLSNSKRIGSFLSLLTLNTTTNGRHELIPYWQLRYLLNLIEGVRQLQTLCCLRDYHHMSSIDNAPQQFAVFSRHMIMWHVYARYCSRRQLQLRERKWVTFSKLWSWHLWPTPRQSTCLYDCHLSMQKIVCVWTSLIRRHAKMCDQVFAVWLLFKIQIFGFKGSCMQRSHSETDIHCIKEKPLHVFQHYVFSF